MVKCRTVTKEIKEWYDSCPHCPKEVIGTSEKQVKTNMGIHIKCIHEKDKE